MTLQCGIVGLPNVGKSTLFNALTKAGIAAENYPFCTIEPNVGVVEVPDARLGALAAIAKPQKVVPAIVEFVDIAGLVAGASKGEGLGNQFLANIRETSAIANVVRCFSDDNVVHVAGKVDPISDIEVIHTELALADMATVDKAIVRFNKGARSGDKEAVKTVAVLEKVQKALDGLHPVRTMDLSPEEHAMLQPLQLLTSKPALYIANVDEHGFENNPLLDRVKDYAAKEGAPVVAICAKLEAEIADLSGEDKAVFLADIGMKEPGLDRLIRATYDLLGLHTLLHRGPEGGARLDREEGRHRAAGRGRDPHRFREGIHPRGSHRLRRLREAAWRGGREGSGQDAPGGQGLRRAGRRRGALPLQRLAGRPRTIGNTGRARRR